MTAARTDRRLPARRTPIVSSRAGVAVLLVAAVFAVAAVCGAITETHRSTSEEAIATTRAALRSGSGTVVDAVFTVGAATWRADRERSRRLVTDGFANGTGAGLSGPPAAGIREIVWRTTEVGVVEASADGGRALIRVVVTTTPDQGPPVVERRAVTAGFHGRDGRLRLDTLAVIG